MTDYHHANRLFKANSSADLSDLSVELCKLPSWFVLAHVHDLGLMRCRQQPLAVLIWFVKRMRGTSGMLSFFSNLNARSQGTITMWFVDTLDHLHFGEDGEDDDSLGGWSQREIDLLVSRLPQLSADQGA